MGLELEPRVYRLTRSDLVAYAAASGDHNPIHQDEQVALAVGLPGIVAHGMLTLALAARYVDEQPGDPCQIVAVGAKFTKPVVVPPDGVDLTFTGVRDGDVVAVTANCEGVSVLGRCRVSVRG